MQPLRVVLQMLTAFTALAQSEDIFHRIQMAMAPLGAGEVASTALTNHDYARVEDILARLRPATKAEQSEVLALRGAIEFLDGKMQPAADDFRDASRLSPLKDSDTFTFAMALVNVGNEAQARPLLAALAEKYPARAIYVYWLGRLDYSQRRYQEAVEKLKRASELDSQSARVWDSLGLAFDMQGRMAEALEAFQKAAELNRSVAHPSPWPAHDLGFLLLRMDRPTEAEASLREAIRYDPHLVEAHYHLGRALEKEDRTDDAIAEYRSAVSEDLSSADACYSLAMLYRKLHREKEANTMFEEYRRRKEALASGR